MNEQTYRLLALVIFISGAAISMYFRLRAERNSEHERISLHAEGRGLALALRLTGLALWLGVFAYLVNPGYMMWAHAELAEWIRLCGAALGLVANGLAYWVFSSLGNNVTPTVVTRSRHKLVTIGPYRWVRHPLYSVGFLSYISFAMLAANWYVAVLAVVTMVILGMRVPKEERALIERNGQSYLDYARRTGRFFPRLWGPRELANGRANAPAQGPSDGYG